MWTDAIQAQSRLLNAYASLVRAGTASISAGLQNAERMQRMQFDLVSQNIEFWQALLGSARQAAGNAPASQWDGQERRSTTVLAAYSGIDRRKAA